MAGIVSYGVYVPWYRIDRKVLYSTMGWLGQASILPGEKAIGSFDEDSITMAVAAGMNCLDGIDRDHIDGVYFASVTLPYKQRQNAAIIATALDLRSNIKTADFTGSTRSGTTALNAAFDAIKAKSVKTILVCVADCRAAKPGSPQEQAYGDAAAAFLLGEADVVATLQGSYSVSYDFADRWMADFDKFDRPTEDRWVKDEGYNKFISQAISGLAKKHDLNIQEAAKVAYPCLYARDHANIGKGLGLEPDQIQEHFLDSIGDCGSAYPLILLAAALEGAHPNDSLIVASWGSGSDALSFQVSEKINDIRGTSRGVKKNIMSKNVLSNYGKYACFRNIIPMDMGVRAETGIPWDQKPLSWRHRREILGLVGVRCTKCGTPHFPVQRVCVNPQCKAFDEMAPYRFSDKKARVFTYTEDHLGFTMNPPAIYGMLDFEGGGRNEFEITDCEPGSLEVGMEVRMSLRRKFVDEKRGTYFYFWKAVPMRE